MSEPDLIPIYLLLTVEQKESLDRMRGDKTRSQFVQAIMEEVILDEIEDHAAERAA